MPTYPVIASFHFEDDAAPGSRAIHLARLAVEGGVAVPALRAALDRLEAVLTSYVEDGHDDRPMDEFHAASGAVLRALPPRVLRKILDHPGED